MKIKRELITYLISGVVTTGVNYLLYAGFLAMHIPYLAANSAAWAGAVLTAYILNRRPQTKKPQKSTIYCRYFCAEANTM